MLHPPGGEFLPLSAFWTHKTGKKAGMVFHQCIKCMKYPKSPKLGKIDSPEQRRILSNYKKLVRGNWKTEKGVLYKKCTGPAHADFAWLPAEEKYFYITKRGTLYAACRLCVAYRHAQIPEESGWIPVEKVRAYYEECVRRVGMMEAARRIGLTDTQLRKILNGRTQFVLKAKLRKMMLELISMRRKHEVRHKDSIKHGSYLRGRPEKRVENRDDLYRKHGDADNERKRQKRRFQQRQPS